MPEAPAVPIPEASPALTPAPAATTYTYTAPVRTPTPTDVGPPPLQAAMINAPEPQVLVRRPMIRPFSAVALAVKVGFAGIGFDVATPLARRFNLRTGLSLYTYNGSYSSDGLILNGDVQFRSATAGIDIFPFNNGFRITPGVTYYNGNAFNATVMVPGGDTFDLGDGGTDVSSTTDPVHGTAAMSFGSKVAPSITIGSGNMIPRNGHHLSFPFEMGVEYINDPHMTVVLAGTACDSAGMGCANIATDPTSQQNLQQEVDDINSVIHYLRFYPILSFGVAWRFGSWHQ